MELEERIKELEAGLKARQAGLQRAQNVVQNEMQAIISINGGLSELKKLQEDLNKSKEKKE